MKKKMKVFTDLGEGYKEYETVVGWRKIHQVVSLDMNTPYKVNILIEANFCLKTKLTEEEEKRINDATDTLEYLMLELRRKNKKRNKK